VTVQSMLCVIIPKTDGTKYRYVIFLLKTYKFTHIYKFTYF